jgi:c-di-GMP-binding flagellar brake protein YcgR
MTTAAVLERQPLTLVRDPWSIRHVLTRFVRSDDLTQSQPVGDRRAFARIVVAAAVEITPVNYEDGEIAWPESDESVLRGTTSDISLGGLGFLHDEPLSTRHALVTITAPEVEPAQFLVEVRWSQVQPTGDYLTGGQFLGVVNANAH